MKRRYGKLVRDLVPDLLRKQGYIVNQRTMETDEYRRELLYKLIEEAEELRKAGYDPSDKEGLTEELADIFEVIDAVLKEFDISRDAVIAKQTQKRAERGAFEKRIFLESTIDNRPGL